MADYIPSKDADALLYMQTFAAGLTASPATYDVSAGDALTVTNAVAAFSTALSIAVDPATKTVVTVNDKDEARIAAEAIVRQFYNLIKVNAGISDGAKLAIGVRPVNDERTPINAPSTSPLLNILGNTPGFQTVRYADSATPDSGSKPAGAIQLQLYVVIDDEITANEDEAKFIGAFTRNPIPVNFQPDDDGKIATYFARWANRKGEAGPWSLPVSMRIAA